MCQNLFLSCNFIKKETLAQGFSCMFCKIFKNIFFTEHLWMTAYFTTVLKDLDFLFLLFFFSFSLTNVCLPCHLHKEYAKQPTVLLAPRYLNIMILTDFENLNSISNIFQETHDFLVSTDPLIMCIC